MRDRWANSRSLKNRIPMSSVYSMAWLLMRRPPLPRCCSFMAGIRMSSLRMERSSVVATWSPESDSFDMLSKAKHLLTTWLQTLRSPQGDISHVGLPLFLLFLLASAVLVAVGSESSDVVTPEL